MGFFFRVVVGREYENTVEFELRIGSFKVNIVGLNGCICSYREKNSDFLVIGGTERKVVLYLGWKIKVD